MRLKFGGNRYPHSCLLDGELFARQEAEILWLLMCHRCVTMDMICDVLWPDEDDTPDTFWEIIKLLIWRVRKRIKAGGWGVVGNFQWHRALCFYTLVRADEIRIAA